jgi:hypothetical protein
MPVKQIKITSYTKYCKTTIMTPPFYTNPLRPPPTLKNPHKTKNGPILHTLVKKPNLSRNFSKTLQYRSRTQHATPSTDYSPHKTTPKKTNTRNQVYTNWHVPIAKKRMLDRQVDLSPLDSANTSGIINMQTTNQNLPNTF